MLAVMEQVILTVAASPRTSLIRMDLLSGSLGVSYGRGGLLDAQTRGARCSACVFFSLTRINI